jgi:hypothetical protein
MSDFSLKNRLVILLIVFFLLIDARSVWAFGIGENIDCKAMGLISPSRAIKCMFAEYGITDEMVKENVKYLDVASYKYPYPEVTLTFSPTDPKPGEKVTASATPTNFGNPPEMLYYTWYLQKKDCTLNPPLKKITLIRKKNRKIGASSIKIVICQENKRLTAEYWMICAMLTEIMKIKMEMETGIAMKAESSTSKIIK